MFINLLKISKIYIRNSPNNFALISRGIINKDKETLKTFGT